MSNIPEVLAQRIGPLVDPFHEAFERSRHRVDTDYRGLVGEDQEWLRSHAIRGLLYQELTASVKLPEGWGLAGNHRQNGMVNLTFGSGEVTLRVVHRLGDVVPPAGGNTGRRAFYSNRAIADMSDPMMIETHRMLLCWADPDHEAAFELDVVRPLNAGSIRTEVRADIAIPLPRARTDFENLSFDTFDDSEELSFEIDVADSDDE
ncbi:hypothetical protein [Mycolicibacterium lutetiense]|uniref:Uncharacterized protein n=1 Tax=Mycolicibacterium lutetiense TaxID=1641992 RepID=A0ABS4ZVG7_9MYCO|nr:hypothetical protein [Mycolicibacterium lutetiense]MBP2453483.1 hypothetical protein [Mycolicibacterium lutetiense]